MLGKKPACLSDSNARLIEIYRAVRDEVDAVIAHLEAHAARHDQAHYYATRAQVPAEAAARAARLIYLNRTCFNGLFRENRRGEFNVPMGRYTNPTICDAAVLRAASAALAAAEMEARPFDTVTKRAKRGDFVYFDPPYDPVSATASFTSYAQQGFGAAEQEQLAAVVRTLDKKGVRVLLSNSDTPRIRALYDDGTFHVERVYARRAVNSRADRRGPVAEVLVRNF